MFLNHFHMTDQPFVERIPSDRISHDERMGQGINRLKFFLFSQANIALLTGETGVGKSCLLKLFLSSFPDNRYQPVYLHLTHLKTAGLLKLIVSSMGEIPKNTKANLFTQILDKSQRSDATTLLILDEAHLIPSDGLIDLRLLVSSALSDHQSLKIILSGQDELRSQLRRTCHLPLANRISVKYHLPAFSQHQTHAYLDYQMQTVGSNDKVFEPEVKTLIHEFSNGIPRQINNIATACLIQAASQNTHKITQAIFSQAVRECQI